MPGRIVALVAFDDPDRGPCAYLRPPPRGARKLHFLHRAFGDAGGDCLDDRLIGPLICLRHEALDIIGIDPPH